MKDEQVIKLMADVGPNAQQALESWVNLQWVEFWVNTIVGCGLTIALISALVLFFRFVRREA